jgi:phage terminase large subunit-like protein
MDVSLELSPDKLRAVQSRLEAEAQRRKDENKLKFYVPYKKQFEFHSAGATHRERLLMAGNQLGKTLAGGFEMAMHATGRYPDWWQGKRFDRPVAGWACGVTNETVRGTVQRVLVGRPDAIGTGAIPKECLAEMVPARGIADLLDTIRVRHVSGGISNIALKSYISGRERFQGETLDVVWLDEEPGAEIYTECLTRTNVGSNPIFITFTPLLGVSEVVRRFLMEESPDRSVTTMTIDDVQHYSAEEKARIIASYPPHEVEARVRGVPTLGSGRIFPIAEDSIAVEHFDVPPHWPRIIGVDFGYSSAFAAAEIAWDRDVDCVYVTKVYKVKEATPILHAAALRPWGNIPIAWPRDGRRETLEGAGIPLARQYKEQQLDLLYEHAQFHDGSVSVEAGLMMLLDRMQTGRFKVFKHLNDFWEEFRLYHRRDGKVFKENDHVLDAVRYACMMLRRARTDQEYKSMTRQLIYPATGLI